VTDGLDDQRVLSGVPPATIVDRGMPIIRPICRYPKHAWPEEVT